MTQPLGKGEKNPSFSQKTLKQIVDKALGKEKNEPMVTYEFTGRKFTEPANRNPYGGS